MWVRTYHSIKVITPFNMIQGVAPAGDLTALDSSIQLGSLTGFKAPRRFTDIFCLFSYLLLVSTLVGVVLYKHSSAVKGFDRPRDSDGKQCVPPYGLLYIPSRSLKRSVCVSKCPSSAGESLSCKPNSVFDECPRSISGLIRDNQRDLCYSPEAKIQKATFAQTLYKSVSASKRQVLIALGAAALVGFIIAATILILPWLATLFLVLFEFLVIVLAASCIIRYFTGRLPFVDAHSVVNYQGSLYLLGLGLLLLVTSIVSITMLVTRFSTIRFIVKVLRLARLCILDNFFFLTASLLITFLSLGALQVNYWLFENIESFGSIHATKTDLSEFQPEMGISFVGVSFMRVLLLLEVLWTHGLIISLSHFVFESKATLWYYGQMMGESSLYNFLTTLKLIFWHLGTICFGSTYTYYSQPFTNAINNSQRISNPADFNQCCYAHNACFRHMSIYGFIPTIMEGLPFWPSNFRTSQVKIALQRSYAELYLQGSFFTNSAKFFTTLLSVSVAYVALSTSNPALFSTVGSMVVPLLITAFVGHEISTAWLDSTGIVGDTIVLNNVIESGFRTSAGSGMLTGHPAVRLIMNEKVKIPVLSVA